MTAELSPQVFAILTAFIEERVGLSFGPSELPIFADKLASRMGEAGFERPLDYYYALRYDDANGAELDALVDALVVNETYFFREADPLTSAIAHVVRPAVEARGHAKVWSAACSTGEEPLTLAMILDDLGLLPSVTIHATDISTRALARARGGVYGPRAMRVATGVKTAPGYDLARKLLSKHVSRAGESHSVERRLVDSVTFSRLNLLDTASVSALGSFDLIVCRNVLIYFKDETVRRVVDGLARALEPGGRLLVGASESLMRFGTMFSCEERSGAFLYKRAT